MEQFWCYNKHHNGNDLPEGAFSSGNMNNKKLVIGYDLLRLTLNETSKCPITGLLWRESTIGYWIALTMGQ